MRRMATRVAIGFAAGLAIAVPAALPGIAAELVTERQLPLAVALAGGRAALEGCLAQGYRIAVTVVDRGGEARVTLRADGANPHLLEGAFRKAYTAAMLRIPTAQLGTIVERNPVAGGLTSFRNITALGGGLSIRVGEEVVGGIGVAGVPVGGAGGSGDEGCARLGLDRILSELTP